MQKIGCETQTDISIELLSNHSRCKLLLKFYKIKKFLNKLLCNLLDIKVFKEFGLIKKLMKINNRILINVTDNKPSPNTKQE